MPKSVILRADGILKVQNDTYESCLRNKVPKIIMIESSYVQKNVLREFTYIFQPVIAIRLDTISTAH